MSVWLVMYKGQTESPYEWSCLSWYSAQELHYELSQEFPDRIWWIEEKDVS